MKHSRRNATGSLPQAIVSSHLPVILAVAFVVLVSCTPRQPDDMLAPVASWNGIQVSGEHFVQEYQLFGTYAPFTDSPELRQYYAGIMLERMLIAEAGRRAGLDTTRAVRHAVQRRSDMTARRHLFNTEVRPTVPEPTEDELRTAFRRSNTRIRAQQIFAPTRQEIDSLYILLQNGADFDRLAEESMQRAGSAQGTAGHMGWVTFNQLDEAPENVLFATQRHHIAPAVASLRGWHIFRVWDVEETVFMDESTFNNRRDRLRFEVFQRRFDEASARFIQQEIFSAGLVVDMQVLGSLYDAIRPSMPNRSHPEEVIRFNNELSLLQPEIDENTPVAEVDGQPFTVGQFLYHMPDIPVDWIATDFRHALEIAIRDSILAHRAQRVRPDTTAAMRLNRKVAEYTALYYSTLQQTVDTLQTEPLAERYYEVWKNEQFVDYQTTSYTLYTFADSLTAVRALSEFQRGQDWERMVASLPDQSVSITQHEATTLEETVLPVHALPVSQPGEAPLLSGPYQRANWAVIHVTDRQTHWLPFDQVRDDVLHLLSGRKIQVAHRELLPGDFTTDEILLDTLLLDRLLPYY